MPTTQRPGLTAATGLPTRFMIFKQM